MRGEWNSKENRSHVSFDYIEGHVDAFIAVLLRAQFLSEWLMTESARDANHRATLVTRPVDAEERFLAIEFSEASN